MKITYVLAALLLVPSLATQPTTRVRTNKAAIECMSILDRQLAVDSRDKIEGREIVAPPWSFACMNDQGPKQCDEPMWVYRSPDYGAQFKNAF